MNLGPFGEPETVSTLFRSVLSITETVRDFIAGPLPLDPEPVQVLAAHLDGEIGELLATRGDLELAGDRLAAVLDHISRSYDLNSELTPAAYPNLVSDLLLMRDVLEQAFGITITFAGEAGRASSGTRFKQEFDRIDGKLVGLKATGTKLPEVDMEQRGRSIGPDGSVVGIEYEERR
ncbi:hypothetical protein [Glycomyces buryatensis]|uniref:Uncharacterized protein n=1 Tax=Glycomyces buryatensis TaxID=2570927 RepID=A0A4S8QIF9_9ACTN|nr:hypothetical protein [Glycomyces buryatensis]THV41169.1 hypothetical protein FAB82_13035 [Glycomyces buryatensis]